MLIAHTYLLDKNEDELIGTFLSPCERVCQKDILVVSAFVDVVEVEC